MIFFQCANSGSLKDRVLKGLRLRDKSIAGEEDLLRPLVKVVGNIHGNEPTGIYQKHTAMPDENGTLSK